MVLIMKISLNCEYDANAPFIENDKEILSMDVEDKFKQ